MCKSIDKRNNLTIVPSVTIWKIGGEFYFDRKFHDGIISYCNGWVGTVSLVMRIADISPPEFGLILFEPTRFPAELIIIENDEQIAKQHINQADILLASGDNYKNFHLSALCKQQGVKCIYSIEYIFNTRFQIIMMSELRGWKKIKSIVWTVLTEFKRRKAFGLADGIQANGAPAYRAYNKFVDNSLLYFDSRNSADLNITATELDVRLLVLDNNEPLRLGFSGRLITMKGVDHLIEVARILKEVNIPFSFDVFGAGDLESLMKQKIKDYKLEGIVNIRGNVDFTDELIPFIKANLDLFVCCHRQSDPSCTYLETYACGVPIVGYANKAHQGILDKFNVGWSVPINNIKALADKIIYLNSHREEIKTKANNARIFSIDHTFEKTFSRRIEQCAALVKGK